MEKYCSTYGDMRITCIKRDGTLWAWATFQDGFLGNGTYTNQVSPVKLSEKTNWVQISSNGNDFHTVLEADGNIYGWGKMTVVS